MNKLTFEKSFEIWNIIALERLDTPNIFRYTLLYATLILEKVVFL